MRSLGVFLMMPSETAIYAGHGEPTTVAHVDIGFAGDIVTDPVFSFREEKVHWGLAGLRVVDRRADLLTAGQILDDAAIDPYIFLRDAYLQRRASLVHDGNSPASSGQEDFWDEVNFDSKGQEGAVPKAASD